MGRIGLETDPQTILKQLFPVMPEQPDARLGEKPVYVKVGLFDTGTLKSLGLTMDDPAYGIGRVAAAIVVDATRAVVDGFLLPQDVLEQTRDGNAVDWDGRQQWAVKNLQQRQRSGD